MKQTPESVIKGIEYLEGEIDRLKSANTKLRRLLQRSKAYLDSGNYPENQNQYELVGLIESALKDSKIQHEKESN